MQNTNPLLAKENSHRLKAIPFDQIKTEHFLPAIEAALEEARAALDELRRDDTPPTCENTILKRIRMVKASATSLVSISICYLQNPMQSTKLWRRKSLPCWHNSLRPS
ncbi:MAG: hypothetical protein U1C33_05335 [Candidatus Cloacimonadaceae bacterium]|nr:hypothetical protein [Candidatus Cloacimonadaceae bacterium]